MTADYSLVDRLLHRVALGSTATAQMLHQLERNRYLEDAPEDCGGHVFVTGLARAGTTILLRELHATGHFGSLLYADMPFVLAPNLWASLSRGGRRPIAASERGHGDGIAINLDSPEALDEVFWRVFNGQRYIRPDGLLPHDPGGGAIASYRDFMRLVLRRRGKARYLSKDNNDILRLGPLAAAMPDSTFLLVVRAPQSHAASLLRQHLRGSGGRDRFRRDYVRWLGHHEFGNDHRPFRFPGSGIGDPKTLKYWRATWVACYSALEPVVDAHSNIVVVSYERLCTDPRTWEAICKRIGVPATDRREIRAGESSAPRSDDDTHGAGELYERYLERSII